MCGKCQTINGSFYFLLSYVEEMTRQGSGFFSAKAKVTVTLGEALSALTALSDFITYEWK